MRLRYSDILLRMDIAYGGGTPNVEVVEKNAKYIFWI